MDELGCFVSVPVASFRSPRAREYLETLPVPAPATLYGMLCSAVGEPDRLLHAGCHIALAVLQPGARSRVLRTVWRVKDAGTPLGIGENKRPDFQELLTQVTLAVFVRDGGETTRPTLATLLAQALSDPASVRRFGGLCLGESTSLVDEFRPLRESDISPATQPTWVLTDPDGRLALPVWVDHVGAADTVYRQFRLAPLPSLEPPEQGWVRIAPGGD